MRGRSIPLSIARRNSADLVWAADDTTKGVLQRRMNLARLVEAHRGIPADTRPLWTAVFAKAWALVARETPELRRAYVKFPWPHIYEYPASVAGVVVEVTWQGEGILVLARVKAPEDKPIADVSAAIRHVVTAPPETVKEVRLAVRIARMPLPIRRIAWWLGLNLGRQRPNYLGTFGISVTARLGADVTYAVHPLSTLLTYTAFGEDGGTTVTCSFDHRAFDGSPVARGLKRLEDILLGPVVDELNSLAR